MEFSTSVEVKKKLPIDYAGYGSASTCSIMLAELLLLPVVTQLLLLHDLTVPLHGVICFTVSPL